MRVHEPLAPAEGPWRGGHGRDNASGWVTARMPAAGIRRTEGRGSAAGRHPGDRTSGPKPPSKMHQHRRLVPASPPGARAPRRAGARALLPHDLGGSRSRRAGRDRTHATPGLPARMVSSVATSAARGLRGRCRRRQRRPTMRAARRGTGWAGSGTARHASGIWRARAGVEHGANSPSCLPWGGKGIR